MKLEQIYTGCLAVGTYYIESKGEAIIIDPLREVEPYLKKLEEDGVKLKYIFETHFHADFVSGHVDLARKTGATIVYGPTATAGYDIHVGTDGEVFKIGDIELKLMHTPGHTLESSSWVLTDEKGKQTAIFTGDALFIGDVGRPDLAIKAGAITEEDLAGMLFDSLRNKIMLLPDDIIVYPNHGAGSACGKNMSDETFDTLGNQKKTNYALRADMTKEEFIKEVLTGLTAPPQYFPKNAMMNKTGYESIDAIYERGEVALSPSQFEEVAKANDALILDTRDAQVFKDGFVPNSINIGLEGDFAPWIGALIIDMQQAIILITEKGQEKESITRLARVGYGNVLGFLDGGVAAWKDAGKKVDTIVSISAEELAQILDKEEVTVLDARKPNEYLSEHILVAENFPLDYINSNMNKLDKSKVYHIHCAGGYRSMITASILKARGFNNIVDICGGFDAITETSVPKSDFVCPSTL